MACLLACIGYGRGSSPGSTSRHAHYIPQEGEEEHGGATSTACSPSSHARGTGGVGLEHQGVPTNGIQGHGGLPWHGDARAVLAASHASSNQSQANAMPSPLELTGPETPDQTPTPRSLLPAREPSVVSSPDGILHITASTCPQLPLMLPRTSNPGMSSGASSASCPTHSHRQAGSTVCTEAGAFPSDPVRYTPSLVHLESANASVDSLDGRESLMLMGRPIGLDQGQAACDDLVAAFGGTDVSASQHSGTGSGARQLQRRPSLGLTRPLLMNLARGGRTHPRSLPSPHTRPPSKSTSRLSRSSSMAEPDVAAMVITADAMLGSCGSYPTGSPGGGAGGWGGPAGGGAGAGVSALANAAAVAAAIVAGGNEAGGGSGLHKQISRDWGRSPTDESRLSVSTGRHGRHVNTSSSQYSLMGTTSMLYPSRTSWARTSARTSSTARYSFLDSSKAASAWSGSHATGSTTPRHLSASQSHHITPQWLTSSTTPPRVHAGGDGAAPGGGCGSQAAGTGQAQEQDVGPGVEGAGGGLGQLPAHIAERGRGAEPSSAIFRTGGPPHGRHLGGEHSGLMCPLGSAGAGAGVGSGRAPQEEKGDDPDAGAHGGGVGGGTGGGGGGGGVHAPPGLTPLALEPLRRRGRMVLPLRAHGPLPPGCEPVGEANGGFYLSGERRPLSAIASSEWSASGESLTSQSQVGHSIHQS